MKYLVSLILLVLFAKIAFGQKIVFDIRAFKAISDGKTMNTLAIQKAIDAAFANGGGNVIIPKGVFVTGAIVLKSNVDLTLEEGAVLQGSDKRSDYEKVPHPALIVAIGQHHFSIAGKGTIDGQGRALIQDIDKRIKEGSLVSKDWATKFRSEENIRTNLFYFEDCQNIKITGVTCKDATSWVTHYERSKNIIIDSIRVESTAYWNNDGIDIVDCKNVRITNSFINAADDAICLKSANRNDYCDSIYVSNCTLRSSANAFKIGTGSVGGFKNITVRDLKIYDTYRSAIALETVDGGFLENIDVQHVTATNTGNAIFIRLGHRNKDDVYSSVKNIYINDVKVEIPAGKPDAGYEMEGPLLMYPPDVKPIAGKFISVSPWNYKPQLKDAIVYPHNVFPSSITGLPNHAVENITIENVAITYQTVADKSVNYCPLDSMHIITEATKDYPEFSMFGELPVWGFYVRHVKGLTMKNITISMQGKDFRNAILFNDVKPLAVKGVNIKGANVKPAIVYNDVVKAK